ncbi:MAG: hypothetical protein F6J90_25945 [Moorea sp. SIOASIH]|uniref:hypothetical protein n=1 Tax=Moorena sp. SIOASIH TaxID=2607817 RepID=UPI0013B94A7B|nr:hypothetical protein [Moorena sp. SIOASIH]NEO39587.1 hypothetical protein [Moorena sp. SIOASIH]
MSIRKLNYAILAKPLSANPYPANSCLTFLKNVADAIAKRFQRKIPKPVLIIIRYTRLFPCSRFPIPDSRFPIPDSRFPIPDSLLNPQTPFNPILPTITHFLNCHLNHTLTIAHQYS